MSLKVLYAGPEQQRSAWLTGLKDAAQGATVDVTLFGAPEDVAPEAVDYLVYAPNGPVADLRAFTNLKAILSLWAGVESILARPDLPDVPVIRMAEPGLERGMRDYVVGHVLRAHLGVERQRAAQAAGRWDESLAPPLAEDRRVGVLGLGALGAACAAALVGLRFQVAGWSRREKAMAGVECFAGQDALQPFLARSEILVCLLPLTDQTRGLLDADAFAALPSGAHFINAARGPIVDDDALLAALDERLESATLDVFDKEPLPPGHPFWTSDKVLVTPHVASVTRVSTGSRRIIAHIENYESGADIDDRVDREAGY